MKRKLKGGIEGIIAVIILAGLVVALIIAVILPSVVQTNEIGDTGISTLSKLEDTMK